MGGRRKIEEPGRWSSREELIGGSVGKSAGQYTKGLIEPQGEVFDSTLPRKSSRKSQVTVPQTDTGR